MAADYSHSSSSSFQPHLCFFIATLFMFMGITWYINYESILEGVVDQIKLLLMLSPLLLLLALHLFSKLQNRSTPPLLFSSFLPLPDETAGPASREGGSSTPWGVGLLLVLLLFMVSYQSDFRERWFPLLWR
ncbi:unnamed protein product [Cuscuta campestris]|uniref:Uncharacterized protein n=1 Tax=Cuscuta campestris TaxID=132261 RepID=A0A484LJS7_9ASTE|nr:unnamed protein product [Cuscuta campestris]